MKIRIKMPNGAEFEAEGSENFIMSERAKFLEIFAPSQLKTADGNETLFLTKLEQSSDSGLKDEKEQSDYVIPDNVPIATPAKEETESNDNSSGSDNSLFFLNGIEKVRNTDIINKINNNINNFIDSDGKLPNQAGDNNIWQNITKKGKSGYLIIASKPDKLAAQDAVLILLAAERILKNTGSIPALSVSKIVRESGFHHARLDRLLLHYIRSGLLKFEGTKRNRLYSITEQGFQQAALIVHSLFNK